MKYSKVKQYIGFILVNAILLQVLFAGIAVTEYGRMVKKTTESVMNAKKHYYSENLKTVLNAVDGYLEFLEANEVFRFVKIETPYRGEKKAAERERIEKLLGELSYTDRYFDAVFVLGENENCENICSHAEFAEPIRMEDLQRTGVQAYLDRHYEEIFRFQKEEIVLKNREKLSEETVRAVENFCTELDGAYLYYRYSPETANPEVFVLNAEYLGESLFSEDGFGLNPIILSSAGETVFGEANVGEAIYSERIEPSNNTLVICREKDGYGGEMLRFSGICGAILLLTAGLCIYFGKKHAELLQKPYVMAANLFSMTGKSKELSKIEIRENSQIRKGNVSYHIFRSFLVLVILPGILSGAIYSGLIFRFCERTEAQSLCYFEHQTGMNVRGVLSEAEESVAAMTEERFRKISKKTNRTALMDSEAGIGGMYFDGYILYDAQLNAVAYSDQTRNKPGWWELKKEIIGEVQTSEEDFFAFTYTVREPPYQSVKVFGKRIRTATNAVLGYLVGVTERELFANAPVGGLEGYLIKDRAGRVLETGLYDADERIFSEESRSEIPEYGISVYTCGRGDYAWSYLRNCLICFLLIFAVSMIFAWMSSIRFTAPFTEIAENISQQKKSVRVAPNSIKGHSELELILDRYNAMVDDLNRMIEEKIRTETRQKELELLKNQAEINALQHQMNPHFLYNTMEMLNMRFFRLGEYEMCEVIFALTQILRYAMNHADSMVSLEDEIKYARKYALIQQKRFDGRLLQEWEVAEEAKECPVPKMVIQPLIENAVGHGLKNCGKDTVTVRVEVQKNADMLLIRVRDDGAGIKPERLAEIRKELSEDGGEDCLALRNIQKRLRLYYGEKSRTEILSEYGKFTEITLYLPTGEAFFEKSDLSAEQPRLEDKGNI